MIRVYTFCFVLFLLQLISCRQADPVPDPGVPLSLAEQRKQQVSHIGYQLDLSIPDTLDSPVTGKEIIRFYAHGNDHDLALDFKAAEGSIHTLAVNGESHRIRHVNEHLLIDAKRIVKGQNTVEIAFEAGSSGLNRSQDFLYALLVPDRARTVFPCFDQPDLKAAFTLSLSIPRRWKAMTNGSLKDSASANGRTTLHFQPSDTISTYLFSFTAGDFSVVEKVIAGRTMQFFHRETDSAKIRSSMPVIFDMHARSLRFMEEYTGIAYPFRKFSFAAIPDFQFGGMEHPGAVWYNAGLLFLDSSATRTQEIRRANVIAHETSHMWFGDLVTMRWFNDVWMKEVFANFMADKIVEQALPDNNAGLKFVLAHYPPAYQVDRTPGANPIRQQLDNLREAGTMYGDIIYHKAPIMMLQLEKLIGKEALRKGLQQYLRDHAFGNASWPDLIAILDAHAGEDLTSWNESWVNRAGRPSFPFPISDTNSYGLFTVDTAQIAATPLIKEPVMRTFHYLNLYENMLEGRYLAPEAYLQLLRNGLQSEKEELVSQLLLDQLGGVFWRFLSQERRAAVGPSLENELWQGMSMASSPNVKKMFFKTWTGILLTDTAQKRLYDIWKQQAPPAGVTLSEDEYTDIAAALAIRNYPASQLLQEQLARIQNPDRKRRFEFLLPALSPVQGKRDEFFASLRDPSNRKKEAWVGSALRYLHHPLRGEHSEKYIRPSLDMLEEIQRTGDIFFPQNWLQSTLDMYSSKSAANTVREFLDTHPGYNGRLKNKLLQASDYLFRAEKLAGDL